MTDKIKPPTRMSKSELKKALLDFGYTPEQLLDNDGKIFKRPVLLEKLLEHQHGEEGLIAISKIEEDDDVGVVVQQDTQSDKQSISGVDKIDDVTHREIFTSVDDSSNIENDADTNEPLTPSDTGWTQFVLGKFLDDEVDGKNPRVEGLRRVAGELVGELIEEGCDLVAAPTEENKFRACVKAWGVFLRPDGVSTKRFEALADAHSENCFEDYATYLVAMADTRAKGRMFRNALHLRRVVAAEEISKTVGTAADIQKGGAIHTSQISMIRLMSDRNHIKIIEILEDLCIEYKLNESTGDVNLQSLSYEDALAVSKKMREIKESKENSNGK